MAQSGGVVDIPVSFMDRCAYAAASMLARGLPGAELLEISCRAKPGNSSIPSAVTRDWLVRHNGRLIGIEGLITDIQAKDHIMKRWFQGADPAAAHGQLCCDVLVSIEPWPPTQLPPGMEASDPILSSIVSRLEEPLAVLIVAPSMAEATVKAKAPGPGPRF